MGNFRSLSCSFTLLFALLLSALPVFGSTFSSLQARNQSSHEYDVIIYGNTVAALAAAIQTTRMGKTVAVVTPREKLGGLTASGLGWTDSKNGSTIGGIAREFYERVYERYDGDSLWDEEKRSAYVRRRIRAQPGTAIDTERRVQWTFEPKVAEAIWEDWVKEEDIPVFRRAPIERSRKGVTMDGTTITSLRTVDGEEFRGKMFIDASYEGDLMEAAGVPWAIGRESRDEYDESTAGVRIDVGNKNEPHQENKNQKLDLDPYVEEGNPDSGFISGIQQRIEDPEAVNGEADPLRIQAYNYRLCLTTVEDNRVPFSKPDDYDESDYEMLFRYAETGYTGRYFTTSPMPNDKTDTNSAGQVSTDFLGGNFNNKTNYMQWSYEEREKSAERHKSWTQGLLWSLAYHERMPESIRNRYKKYGYAKDEFVGNDNFPYELYIREGRRMKGVYVMKQSDITDPTKSEDEDAVVGMGAYTFDVHRVERVVVDDQIYNEGGVHVPNQAPFPIPFDAIIPHAEDATNFLNPVTMSSTHIAFAAIRMEPTYMILGQSAATAAVLAIEKQAKIQDIDRSELTKRLRKDKQVIMGTSSAAKLSTIGGLSSLLLAFSLYMLVHTCIF